MQDIKIEDMYVQNTEQQSRDDKIWKAENDRVDDDNLLNGKKEHEIE